MRTSPTGLLLVLLPAAALAGDRPTLDHILAGRTAGTPRSCIQEEQIDDSQYFDSGQILYRMKGGPDYVNTPPGCRGVLRRDAAIASRTPSTSICHGDIIRVFDPVTHADYGSCGLGDFVPYPRPKR